MVDAGSLESNKRRAREARGDGQGQQLLECPRNFPNAPSVNRARLKELISCFITLSLEISQNLAHAKTRVGKKYMAKQTSVRNGTESINSINNNQSTHFSAIILQYQSNSNKKTMILSHKASSQGLVETHDVI